MDWIDLAQERDRAGSCVYGDEPSDPIKWGNFLSSLGHFSFSGRTLLHVVS
jgi:hypothetical protein